MTLAQLFQSISETGISGDSERAVAGLAYDSRRVSPGDVFFAISGFRQDGHRFISDALDRGAIAIVSEAEPRIERSGAAWVQVPNIRRALALASAEFYRYPSRELDLVGITGTNGKTTTAFLIASILDAAGRRPALFGTIEYRPVFGEPERHVAAPNTTPESLDLQRMLREAADNHGKTAVMEASSHSLALDRVSGCTFHTAVWTNFSRDHLDFHPTVDDYYHAKARLFLSEEDKPAPRFAVLNADDSRAVAIAGQTTARVLTFGIEQSADVSARKWKANRSGVGITVQSPIGRIELQSPLAGPHNVYNLLAATAAGIALDVSPERIQQGVSELTVPGRMEAIQQGQSFEVYVDYAHTEDALKNLVTSARGQNPDGRLIVVFGCGGDRDRSKRPLMGIAAAACDRVILTSDNPRTEDPLQIINDVTVGLQKIEANYVVEPDRARAIERAVGEAKPGDTVLIAGKGHENYQIIGDTRIPFDDRDVARSALRSLGFESEPRP